MPLGAFKAALMGTAGVSAGADVVLLHDTDYSNASTASITSGIDSTYGEYIFKFYNINPATDGPEFTWQANATDSTSYDETITAVNFKSAHYEGSPGTSHLGVTDDANQSQGTAFQQLMLHTGNGADESLAGELHLFNPSSTTYVKHFFSRVHSYASSNQAQTYLSSGYINTTTAIDDIQFKMSSGNFDGTIKMWGVK